MLFDKHVSRRLAAHLDGKLAGREARQVETHIVECSRCRAELDQVRLGMAILRELPLAPAPEHVWTAIELRLSQPGTHERSPLPTLRFATGLALVVLAAVAGWYLLRPPGAQWEVVRLAGSPAIGSVPIAETGRIGRGESIETDGLSRARIKVGEVGSVDIEPNTRLAVVTVLPTEHRLALRSGQITAKIFAPPRLFFVETPSGTAIDLGCEYTLQCDTFGFGTLRVKAGWVSFEFEGRESLVPAGAICRARPRAGPGTPYFEDATDAFVDALDAFDFDNGGTDALRIVLAESHARDTLTLWHLLSRVEPGERPAVYERMAALSPPPVGISREDVLRLDPEILRKWREELAWTW